jgi:hypothetical protein
VRVRVSESTINPDCNTEGYYGVHEERASWRADKPDAEAVVIFSDREVKADDGTT